MMRFNFPADFVKINNEDFRKPLGDGKLIRVCRKQGLPVIILLNENDTPLDLKTLPAQFFSFRMPYEIKTTFKLD